MDLELVEDDLVARDPGENLIGLPEIDVIDEIHEAEAVDSDSEESSEDGFVDVGVLVQAET